MTKLELISLEEKRTGYLQAQEDYNVNGYDFLVKKLIQLVPNKDVTDFNKGYFLNGKRILKFALEQEHGEYVEGGKRAIADYNECGEAFLSSIIDVHMSSNSAFSPYDVGYVGRGALIIALCVKERKRHAND